MEHRRAMKQDELRSTREQKKLKKEVRCAWQKRVFQEEKELRQREEGVEAGQIEALLGGGPVGGCILDMDKMCYSC